MYALSLRFISLSLSLSLSLCLSLVLLSALLDPLSVHAANLTGLSVAPQNPTLNVGRSLPLNTTANYDDGTQQIIKQAKQISANGSQTCVLATDGTVKCWGWGTSDRGDLGIDTAVAISTNATHSCAVLTNGTVQCWGNNDFGKLGNGTTVSSLTPVTVSGISNAVSVSAGYDHTCAVLTDGMIRCWGANATGELGNGTTASSPIPVTVSGISNAVSVSASFGYACATLADGTARCWGANLWGQLGNGTSVSSTTPVTVSGISTAVSVSTGVGSDVGYSDPILQSCARLANGTVQCWGGTLGIDVLRGKYYYASLTPVTIPGLSTAISVSTGGTHACAMLSDGTLRCWGSNQYSKLGDGTTALSLTPVTVKGIGDAVAISAGTSITCAILADGAVRCWGYNNYLQPGNGAANFSMTPVAVSGINTAASVSAGNNHTCAMLTDGGLRCWGSNEFNQLGDGTFVHSPLPVTVTDIGGVSPYPPGTAAVGGVTATSVNAGANIACAVLTDGTGWCWGDNEGGQLGYLFPGYPMTSYRAISGNALAISAGDRYSCSVLFDGTVYCWGYYFSSKKSGPSNAVAISAGSQNGSQYCVRFADGTLQCEGVPVSGITTAIAVSTGRAHTCAALSGGALQCWGANQYGQLGNGTITPSTTPVSVSGISNAVSISAGSGHTCAVLADGTIRCWGGNTYGQLGNGTTTSSNVPVTVSGISNAISVSAGSAYTCATLTDGTLRCWGYNYHGQLGNGTAGYYTTPTSIPGYAPLALTWASSNPSVAVVNAVGRVSALSLGSTLITVSGGGFSASTTVTVVESSPADLSLTLSAPTAVQVGQTVAYTLTVTNNGPSTASGITVSGTLPSCTVASLVSGASATCTQTVTPTSAGTLAQTMSVSANETDPVITNNIASISTTVNPLVAADLQLTITDAPDPVRKGAKLVYTLTVTNRGPSTATGVAVTDVLPANISFVSATTSQGTCRGTTTVTCAVGTLASGAVATVKIILKPRTVGTLNNNAGVSAIETDPNTANNSASASTVVRR